MKLSRRRFLSIGAGAGLSSLAGGCSGRSVILWEGIAFGAYARIQLDSLKGWHVGIEHIRSELLAEIRRMENLFSLFVSDSTLSRLNRLRYTDEQDPAWSDLLALSDRIHTLSAGLFDPSIQPVWRSAYEGGDVEAASRAVGWTRILRKNGHISLKPGQALTFNGIAQGFATDRIADKLRALGAKRVLVNLGEFAAIGGPWRLGVEDPKRGLVDVLKVSDRAVATSSPDAMALSGELKHILHPAIKRASYYSSVTVEASRAAVADGLSTAICLMNPSQLEQLRSGLSQADGVHRIKTYS